MLSQLGDVYDKQSMKLKPKKMMEEKERESFTGEKTEENYLRCSQKREKASRERDRVSCTVAPIFPSRAQISLSHNSRFTVRVTECV